jgi:hypothetical protein
MRKLYCVILERAERQELEGILKRGKTSAHYAQKYLVQVKYPSAQAFTPVILNVT